MKTVISKVLVLVVTIASFISVCKAADQYKFLGTIPASDQSLKEPAAAAMTSVKSCYIADPGSKAVYHYDQTGKSIEVLKQLTIGNSKIDLKEPVDLCVDREDNLYILDNDLGSVFIRPKKGEIRRVGQPGSALGFIDDGRSLAVDKNANIYVLSAGEGRVEIFSPQGNFLTWINAAAGQNFLDPVAIGINGADELFVLEAKSGTVYIFDAHHNASLALPDLAKKAAIKKPADIAVLPNGEFIILDSDNCKAVHFNRNGSILSVIGSKGTPAKGVFGEAVAVSASPTLPDVLVIADESGKSAQIFQVPTVASPLTCDTEPIEIKLIADDVIPPFIDFAVAPNGTRYVIPLKDRRSILVYKPDDKQPSMKLTASEPAALATDASGNIYVLDKDDEEVLMYDPEGVMIRKFGQEISQRLKDANGIAVLSDGSVLVTDTKDDCVKKWSAQGVYQGVLIPGSKSVLPSPYKIKVDAKENIYVWDNDRNMILRYDKQGVFSGQDIRLRTLKATENTGKVMGIAVDVINQFYVFNQTTGQIEVYDWKNNPVCIFRYGQPGKGADGFDDVEIIGLNPKNFVLYAAYDDKTVKAIRMPFTDYVGKGDQLYGQQQYDEAWQVYMTGYQRMEKPEALRKYIAKRYATAGMTLTSRYDLVRGMGYLKQALSLEPENAFSQEALCYGYKMCFKKYALEEDYDELVKTSDQMVEEFQPKTSGQAEISPQNLRVMQNALLALDSISTELVKSGSEKKIQTAVQVHTRLASWQKGNARYLTGLTQANWAFYRFLKGIGAPGFELQALLKKAEEASQGSLDEIKKTPNANKTQPYIRAELLYVEILLEEKNYDKAVSICVNALINPDLVRDMVVRYRELLANAYIGQGSYDAAATEYQRILALDTGSKTYRLKLADVLLQAKRYDDAKMLYQQLLIEQRDNAMLTGRIGKVELLKKNYEEASFQLEKALKLSASERDLYGPLAEAYHGASKFKQAIQNYKIAIQQLQQQQSYLRSRISSGQEIDNIQRQISEYLTDLSEIYLRMGKYDDAIESCKEVTTISPGKADGWLNLGNAYMKTGLIYEAIGAFNTAQQLDPSSKSIQQALADAQRLKEKSSQNSPAVEIVKIDINDIFPSLYRNYADVGMQPIGEVVLANNTLLPISGISLTFFVSGLMSEPSSQQVNALVGYSNMAVKLSAIFDQKILANTQDKKLQASIVVKYTHDGVEKIIEKTMPFSLRGRNAISWKDKRWLSAFLDPATPELINYVKKIDVMFHDAGSHGLYESLVKGGRIYSALFKNNFTYSPDPQVSFAQASQSDVLDYLQYPAETLVRKSGDCDDLVGVYCGLLESAGIATAYVDVPGHVFMAFDSQMKKEDLLKSGVDSKDVIVMYDKVWIPVETTLLATRDFLTAWKNGAGRYYAEIAKGNFPELVPLSDARKVYLPSSYVPDNFAVQLPPDQVLKAESERVVREIQEMATSALFGELEARRKAEPQNVYVRSKLAKLYAKNGRFNEAVVVCQEAVRIYPENAQTHKLLASICMAKADYPNALASLKESLKIDGEDALSYINLCKVQLELGDLDGAKTSFENAVRIKPKMAEEYSDLKSKF